MKVLWISGSGDALPIAWRMKQEGTNTQIYIHNKKHHHNYEGIMQRVRITELKAAVSKADVIIFDITRPNAWAEYLECKKTNSAARPSPSALADITLLKMFGLKPTIPSVFGPLGDLWKKDHEVIGAAEWAEDVELDRKLGSDIAKKIGLSIAETHVFPTLTKGIQFLEGPGKDSEWVLKPDKNADLDLSWVEPEKGALVKRLKFELPVRLGSDKFDYILQKKVSGVEISTEIFFDGENITCLNHTFEEKKAWTGNKGPAIGSANNVAWINFNMKDGFLIEQFTKLIPLLKRAEFKGPIDINCIIDKDDHLPYFLEFSPRLGYDAIYCLLSLCKDSITTFFTKGFKVSWKDSFVASQRVSIPPFPYSDPVLLKKRAENVAIGGTLENQPWFWAEDVKLREYGLACAGADGILGVVTGVGDDLWTAVGEVYKNLAKLNVCGDLQYRMDLGDRAAKDLKRLAKWGVKV